MARALVLSTDRVGSRMAGPSIRCLELARALQRAGHPSILAVPQEAPPPMEGVEVIPLRGLPRAELFARVDLAVIPGSAHLDPDVPIPVPMVVDLYDPFLLSGLDLPGAKDEEGTAHFRRERSRLEAKVRRADLFLTASERQRDYWLGVLTAWGRIEPAAHADDPGFRHLLVEVPYGIPPDPPLAGPAARGRIPGIHQEDELLVWGGGIWNWFDPLTLIRAVGLLAASHPKLRLLFLGVRHPNPLMPEMAMATQALELARELDLLDRHVFFGDWVPYDQRGAYLLEAHLGVSTHLPGIETRFAFRTRLLDCIWAGLPVVTTQGDLMADLVERQGLGAVVPPGDPPALAGALSDLLGSPEHRRACREALGELAELYSWDRVVEPLVAFCEAIDGGRIPPRPEPAAGPAADPPPSRPPGEGRGWIGKLLKGGRR